MVVIIQGKHYIEPHKIKTLRLSSMGIEKIPKGILQKFPNVEVLDISENRLKELPEDITCFNKLRIIRAWNNKFTNLPDIFDSFPYLTEVNFTGNNLGYCYPKSLEKCKRLRYHYGLHKEPIIVPQPLLNVTDYEDTHILKKYPDDLERYQRICDMLEIYLNRKAEKIVEYQHKIYSLENFNTNINKELFNAIKRTEKLEIENYKLRSENEEVKEELNKYKKFTSDMEFFHQYIDKLKDVEINGYGII